MNKQILTIIIIAVAFVGHLRADDLNKSPTGDGSLSDVGIRPVPAELKAFTEASFQSISMTPQIHLSASLIKGGATAELRGKDLDQIRAFYASKDWAGLIDLLYEGHYPKYPATIDKNFIYGAIRKLRMKEFHVLLKTSYKPEYHSKLVYFTFAVDSWSLINQFLPNGAIDQKIVLMADRHRINMPVQGRLEEVAPDGVGFFYTWQPQNGSDIFVVLGPPSIQAKYNSFNDEFMNGSRAFENKVKLAEISDEQCAAALRALILSIKQETITWAESVSN